jgi:hypothetical protein
VHAAETRRERIAAAEDARRDAIVRSRAAGRDRVAAAANAATAAGGGGSGSGGRAAAGGGGGRRRLDVPVRQAMDRVLHGWSSPSRVNGYIWIGSADDAANTDALKALGITHVLNTARQAPPQPAADDFVVSRVDLLDHPDEDVTAALPAAFAHIADARDRGGAVLVHCMAGVSRSVAIVAAWLVSAEGMHLKTALDLVRGLGPRAG